MPDSEIDAVRASLVAKPPPVGVAARRERLEEIGAKPIGDDISLKAETIDGLGLEWSLARGSDSSRVLLFLHGGGYCAGSIASHRGMVTAVGRAAGIGTLAVGYRLAPEHPFPAALEDATAAYNFLLAQGFLPSRIALGGESAGGGLTLALMASLRDREEPLPACGWLLSPWVDLEMTGSTMKSKALVDPLIQKASLHELAAAYLAGADPKNPLASPLRADLSGLPPLLTQVGSAETLLDDSVRIIARAGEADVSASLEIWPNMIHAWPLWANQLEASRAALAAAGAFIRARLA